MSVGQQATRTRELRESFKPVFEDETFNLACPKMDDVVERQIIRSRHGKFIGQRELIWKSTQLKVLDVDDLCFHSEAVSTPLQKKAVCWIMQYTSGRKPISLSPRTEERT